MNALRKCHLFGLKRDQNLTSTFKKKKTKNKIIATTTINAYKSCELHKPTNDHQVN